MIKLIKNILSSYYAFILIKYHFQSFFPIPATVYKRLLISLRNNTTKTFSLLTVFSSIMSGSQNSDRIKNNTMPSSSPNGNRSNNTDFESGRNRTNGSDFGPGGNNGSQLDMNTFDESPEVMFYLLTTLVIPSIICFLFVFYNFIRLSHLRVKPSNLLIIFLLIINFIHVSWRSSYIHLSFFISNYSIFV